MAADSPPNYIKTEEWINTGSRDIMIFYPSMQEMVDFSAYIKKCEDNGAVKASGICKIVPPNEWNPRPNLPSNYSDILESEIHSPVKEIIDKAPAIGAYTKRNAVYRQKMTVKSFRELALSAKYSNPKPESSLQEIERQFWRNITVSKPIYGADTPGFCFQPDVELFNVSKLGTILDLLKEEGISIPGVTSTYLYFGMYKTCFAWHNEDCDLYSINFLHFGEPKFWYAIPPEYADRVERLFKEKFPDEYSHCKAYLRHKTFIVTASELRSHGIPYGTMVQWPHEFIITFPRGYHFGFNIGYNCAESTNFALDRWIDYGKNATVCKCAPGAVEVDMRPFMKKYRPDEYQKWHDYWYGSSGVKQVTPSSELLIVELPPIEKNVFDSFLDELAISRNDFNYLWQNKSDFKEEIKFNRLQSQFFPFCSICQFLVPQNEYEQKTEMQSESIRYTTDALYTKSEFNSNVIEFNNSRLLRCRRCLIVVHADCYGTPELVELNTSNESENAGLDSSSQPSTKKRKLGWACKRCEFAREELICASITCQFCGMRGGALIPHNPDETTGKFVHVICAIMSRRSKIVHSENVIYAKSLAKNWMLELYKEVRPWEELGLNKNYLISNIDLFLNTNPSQQLKCGFCERLIVDQFVQCQHCFDNETTPIFFHPYCAFFARMVLEYRDFSKLIVGVCPCHTNIKQESELKLGEYVVFFSKGTVEMVKVLDTNPIDYCHVEFLDSTFSEDVSFSDIIDCECKRIDCNGHHIIGWIIQVRWEGSVFQGYLRQIRPDISYTVKNDQTGKIFTCSRKTLYQLHENKPEAVEVAIRQANFSRQ